MVHFQDSDTFKTFSLYLQLPPMTSTPTLKQKIHVSHPQLSASQLQEVQLIDDYISANRVHEILNQALAKLIQTRPQKVKQGLADILRGIKEKQSFFKKSDFQSMFQSYDFFSTKGGNQVPFTSLIQALEKINVHYTRQEFLNVYPQFKLDRTVKKLDFINIMEGEYKKKIKL